VGDDRELLARYFDVTETGNFEGQNILNVPTDPATLADESRLSPDALVAKVREASARLFERRERRIRPGRDEKILTDWNGLMLRAWAEAAAVFGRPDYGDVARRNADFLLGTMWNGTRLLHAFKDGEARLNGYLDDYANLAAGLLALYELTFEDRWLEAAVAISETMISEFEAPSEGDFFFTGRSHEPLVARTREFFDNATPSGNSVAAEVLLRLGILLDRSDFRARGEATCRAVTAYIRRFPGGFGHMLGAIDWLLGPSRELALVGDPDGFLPAIRETYRARLVVAGGSPDAVPLLAGRPAVGGRPTAYLCEDYVCREPVTDPKRLAAMLDAK
jgi:uncharacterized protein YyaL (SSP411 family)